MTVVVVDTSIWIDHFRKTEGRLAQLISDHRVVQHPFVTGEIAVGNPQPRARTIWALRHLPRIEPVAETEFHGFMDTMELFGTGLGFVDIHVLAAAADHGEAIVWTRDQRMLAQAQRLGLAGDLPS